MMHSRIVVVMALTLATVGPALAAKKLLLNIPLVWRPTDLKDTGVVSLTGLEAVKLQVKTFTDARPDKTKFGENNEDDTPKPVTTSSSVAEFCTENLARILRGSGISIVEDGADFVLTGEVLEFMVTETGTYRGEVRLKVTLLRRGQPVWTSLTSGSNKRFGRSYKAENYYETISDSLLGAAQNLIRSEEFRQKLGAR